MQPAFLSAYMWLLGTVNQKILEPLVLEIGMTRLRGAWAFRRCVCPDMKARSKSFLLCKIA